MASTESTDTNKPADGNPPELKRGRVASFFDSFNPGYIVAGISALATSFFSIGPSFHKLLEKNGRLKELDKVTVDAYHTGYENKKTWVMTPEWEKKFQDAATTLPEHPGAIQRLRKEWIGENLKADGITNPMRMFVRLPKEEQLKIFFTFATVASIAAGAIYSYGNSRAIAEKLHRQDVENNGQKQTQPTA